MQVHALLRPSSRLLREGDWSIVGTKEDPPRFQDFSIPRDRVVSATGLVCELPIRWALVLGPQLTIDRRPHADWLLLSLTGELDLATSPQLAAAVEEASGQKVIVDLSSVSFIDSVGLRTLLQARRSVGEEEFHLVVPEGSARRLLQLTKLEATFSVSDTLP